MKALIDKLLSIGLKKKILMGYVFMSAMIAAILGLVFINFFNIKAKYDAMNVMSNDIQLITQLKADINGIRASFLRLAMSKNPDIWENQEGVIASISEAIDVNMAALKKGAFKEKINEMEKTLNPFKDTIAKELIPLVKEGKVNEALEILRTVQAGRSRVFMGIANEIIDKSREEFTKSTTAINEEMRTNIITVIAVIVVVFSAAFIGSFWFINKYIVRVLHGISASAERVAKGDLTARIESLTGDEFGSLAKDVTNIVTVMRHVMRDIANKTVLILKDATNLTLHGKDVSQKVDKDLERTSTAAAATEEMSATVGDIAMNINNASNAAERAREASSRGKAMIDGTVTSIDEVNTQIELASGKVRDLSEFSKKIDEIVDMIKDIADQTNLLALNAAIEAARAGEQGRGFAVVADEVRKLAQRTASATADINNILGSIHTGTIAATNIMDVAVEKSRTTGEMARKLDESFAEIYNNFNQVSDMMHQVVTATEEQSATSIEISSNLTSIAEDARESSNTVKSMTLSFNKFSANAKEFLRLLDGFIDPKMKIGIIKADYVLWLHRVIDMLDGAEVSVNADEFNPQQSRMGRWYYGEGKNAFGSLPSFSAIEPLHLKIHDLGVKAHNALKRGEMDEVKKYVTEAVKLADDIVAALANIESEA